jgi:hypothetical protein
MIVRRAGIQSSIEELIDLPPEYTAQRRLDIFRVGCQRHISSYEAEPCPVRSWVSADSTASTYAYQARVQIEQVGQQVSVLLPQV